MTKKSNPSKPFKPSPQTILALQSLQDIVEDDAAWGADENEQLKKLASCTQKIDQLQSTNNYPSIIPHRTQEDLDNLVEWAFEEHNIDLKSNGLKIGFTDEKQDDATFFASKQIDKDSPLINVPSKAILSSTLESRAEEINELSKVGGPAISNSPSLILTLTLIMECYAGEKSRFKNYINALPSKLNIPFFSFNDNYRYYNSLMPSFGMQAASVRLLRAQLRDYCGIFRSIMNAKITSLPISCLSLKNFKWAISIVMTRQNALPPKNPSPKSLPVMALIPLWDMFNHDNGKPTTSVTLTNGELSVECIAMNQFNENDPIKMCYGARPSGQLALYCGFVLKNGTPNDEILIDIPLIHNIVNEQKVEGMIPEKQINMLKARTLQKKGVSVDLNKDGSYLCKIPIGNQDDALYKAFGVAGVAVMNKVEFTAYIKNTDVVLPDMDAIRNLDRASSAINLVQEGINKALSTYRVPRDPEVDWESDPGKLIDGVLSIETKLLEDALKKAKDISLTLREGSTN